MPLCVVGAAPALAREEVWPAELHPLTREAAAAFGVLKVKSLHRVGFCGEKEFPPERLRPQRRLSLQRAEGLATERP